MSHHCVLGEWSHGQEHKKTGKDSQLYPGQSTGLYPLQEYFILVISVAIIVQIFTIWH